MANRISTSNPTNQSNTGASPKLNIRISTRGGSNNRNKTGLTNNNKNKSNHQSRNNNNMFEGIFKGRYAGMKEDELTNMSSQQADVFRTTMMKLTFYCEHHLENGHKIGYMVDTLKIWRKQEPIKPTTPTTHFKVLVFQQQMLEFENENRILQKNKRIVFSIIIRMCDEAFKILLENRFYIYDTKNANDVIALIKVITTII